MVKTIAIIDQKVTEFFIYESDKILAFIGGPDMKTLVDRVSVDTIFTFIKEVNIFSKI